VENTKLVRNLIILVIVAFLGIYEIGGVFALNQQQVTVRGAKAEVWNAVENATEKLNQLYAQLNGTIKAQADAIATITKAREALAAAQANNDLNGATSSAANLKLYFTAIAENYPDYGLSAVQAGVVTETAGAFNRIKYDRTLLINAQTDYDHERIAFFPVGLLFPSMEILGENSNPAQPVPTISVGG
jgi:hypothetical protein